MRFIRWIILIGCAVLVVISDNYVSVYFLGFLSGLLLVQSGRMSVEQFNSGAKGFVLVFLLLIVTPVVYPSIILHVLEVMKLVK